MRAPPKRRKLYSVSSFEGLARATLHVRGLRGESGVSAQVFRLEISEVNAKGSIASGLIVDGGSRIACTARLCAVKERRSKKRPPIGVVQIGEHGDTPSLMFPWIGEHLLEAVSVAK